MPNDAFSFDIPKPLDPDEQMSEAQVRHGITQAWPNLPHGSKRQLALLCGYNGKSAASILAAVGRGTAMLPEACRKRISRVLSQLRRGELTPERIGTHPTGIPAYRWRRLNPYENKGKTSVFSR